MALLIWLFGLLNVFTIVSTALSKKYQHDVHSIESNLLSPRDSKISQESYLIRENRVKRQNMLCDVMKSGTFGDPTKGCRMYYSCTENEPIEYKCPKDLKYNNQISVCDLPSQVDYMCNSKHPATWFIYANEYPYYLDNILNSNPPITQIDDSTDETNSSYEDTEPNPNHNVIGLNNNNNNNQIIESQVFNQRKLANPNYPNNVLNLNAPNIQIDDNSDETNSSYEETDPHFSHKVISHKNNQVMEPQVFNRRKLVNPNYPNLMAQFATNHRKFNSNIDYIDEPQMSLKLRQFNNQ